MNAFSFYNPVKIHFGKESIEQLRKELPQYGQNILIVYGGGSIKSNGVYDAIMSILNDLSMNVFELSGVEPNPRVETARKGIAICKEQTIDIVLAVGGGSVIDCSKLIVAGAKIEQDAWDIVMKKVIPTEALPLATVLTIAATASEMNSGSVITNEETKEKYSWGSPAVFPKFSILDPTYTYTLPANQTVNGVVDTMSHILEQYFHNATNTPLTDEMSEGILRTLIDVAPKALKDPSNYEHRETLMLAGTLGLNGFLGLGARGDWATHNIEHSVSAYYDIAHAAGLAIIFPNWMKHNVQVNPARFAKLAENVFGIEQAGKTEEQVALEGIEALSAFWTSIGAPNKLADFDIDATYFNEMVEHCMVTGPFGNFTKLHAEDVRKILEMSL
ncbi:NADH-dependent alcohol dehydrogenase [Lysinibacillus sp. 2017]|uniref:iron-containing alcohol dehydrogenase n=1 Tax=unclassified Lysinibacillus TaxID=2636778 RepID=UPI000D529EC7|nr:MULTISPECIES: iron-containing alcohol dehydrogenase [unclassified Lysinibacillus]AWE08424.1 NADH-dependent alcohol dehydrogenase [Lysinibacillus sp. 2017]TGN34912.1 iron-containing alcohol dehydrogenase [Lysinibacillus sp. S2017]